MATQNKKIPVPADVLASARERAAQTRKQLAMESLSRLETGAQTNPTWKTLGAYAAAVGRRPRLTAEDAG